MTKGGDASAGCRHCLDGLVGIMDRLLGPGGCSWDRQQDHRSLRSYVVEEAYEVVAAIDGGDPSELRDELGDLLLQVVFHCALASREGLFDLDNVVKAISAKLIRRHPHVFAGAQAESPSAVLRQWEEMKKEEAEEAAAGDPAAPRLEAHLPALMQAQKLLERAARVGRGRVPPGGGLSEEAKEGVPEEAFGRRLLDLLEEARLAGVDAELALRSACARLARELDSPSRAVSDRSPPPDDRHGPARN